MALTSEQAKRVAARAVAHGAYGEIAVIDCGAYGHVVTGRKVVAGQGIGRQWSDPDDQRDLAPACHACGATVGLGLDGSNRLVCGTCLYTAE